MTTFPADRLVPDPGALALTDAEADAVLEIAFVTIAADFEVHPDERAAFGAIASRVRAPQSFACIQCGAPLSTPQDPNAMSVACAYCRRDNPLPAHILAFRQHQLREAQAAEMRARAMHQSEVAAKSGRRIALWIAL